MEGISFDYDRYFSEETFIIDDFGEICEDVVRIASANPLYLYKGFDEELRHESPPPDSFIASNRCFEKEVSSLFSDMEYLTEVSPGTDVVLKDMKAIAIAVNPTEFSCKRSIQQNGLSEEATHGVDLPKHMVESSSVSREKQDIRTHGKQTPGNLAVPADYQRILNNYIQKGRRKLEASSYSKMKTSYEPKGKMHASAHATSKIGLVTISSSQPSIRYGERTSMRPCTSVTAIVHNLPVPVNDTAFDKPSSISDSSHQRKSKIQQSTPSAPGSLKITRFYCCPDCSCSFATGELMRKHACIIAEQYQCHLCLREFKKRKTLDHHMKSHDKVFSTDDDLRK